MARSHEARSAPLALLVEPLLDLISGTTPLFRLLVCCGLLLTCAAGPRLHEDGLLDREARDHRGARCEHLLRRGHPRHQVLTAGGGEEVVDVAAAVLQLGDGGLDAIRALRCARGL